LSGTEDAPAIGVNQDGNDQFWMIGSLTLDAIEAFNAGGIQLSEEFAVEMAFMLLRQKSRTYYWEKAGADEAQ
jgi:hypothetical protein